MGKNQIGTCSNLSFVRSKFVVIGTALIEALSSLLFTLGES
jgi:hypothetical protein